MSKILIVEDEESIAELEKDYFINHIQHIGYNVIPIPQRICVIIIFSCCPIKHSVCWMFSFLIDCLEHDLI